jgi:lysophospholipid acyltransferase 1/2
VNMVVNILGSVKGREFLENESCLSWSLLFLVLVKYMIFFVGPLMVITQKVTSLAFSLHDGLTRRDDELTSGQKYYIVR